MMNENEIPSRQANPLRKSIRLRKHLGFSVLISLFFFALGNLLPGISGICFASNLVAALFINSSIELFTMVLGKPGIGEGGSGMWLVIMKRALLFGFVVDGFKVGS
jgi:hypothetical protein